MKNTKFWATLLAVSALSFGSFGCDGGDDDAGGDSGNPSTELTQADKDLTAVESALTAADVPDVSDSDAVAFGDSLNAFSHGFEQAASLAGKSYVFSPFSFHSALGMTAYGAKGDTYSEMAAALNLNGDKEEAARLNGAMRLKLRFDGQNEKSKFEIANRIWVDQTIDVVPEFDKAMDKHYKASLKVVDFKNNYKKYTTVINQWVSNNTGNMIENLIPDGALDSDTRMVLVNAVHFDGDWEVKFKNEGTHDEKFNVSKSDKVDVKMMHLSETYLDYYKSDENKYQTVSKDYMGGQFAMLIVLPDEIDGLAGVASKLDGVEIRKILDSQDEKLVNLSLPKFKIETDIASNKTVSSLKALGMVKAFDKNNADFTGMFVPNDENQSLYIGSIIHKAVIEVDEEGTEAAAATAVIVSTPGSADIEPVVVIPFKADHPFEFILYHKASGTILFAGQYYGK